MCWCRPEIRKPNCGSPACHPPVEKPCGDGAPAIRQRIRYRKKPIVVDAVQWFEPGDSRHDPIATPVIKPAPGTRKVGDICHTFDHPDLYTILTLEGPMRISPGDFIITGVKGEKYACKPDIFTMTYEPTLSGSPVLERELPKYKCHKIVHALKIKQVAKHAHPDPKADDAAFEASDKFEGAHLFPVEDGYHPIPVDAAWYRKHNPEAGGYYVVYEDGYASYSPAAAFESGYTKVS